MKKCDKASNKMAPPQNKVSELGGTNEYYLLILIVVILLIGVFVIYVMKVRPEIFKDLFALELDISNSPAITVLGVIGGLVTAGWWAWKHLEGNAEFHAGQDVFELLSLGKPMTRKEINDVLRSKRFAYRLWGETINDAIDKLAREKSIDLEKMKYSLAKKK